MELLGEDVRSAEKSSEGSVNNSIFHLKELVNKKPVFQLHSTNIADKLSPCKPPSGTLPYLERTQIPIFLRVCIRMFDSKRSMKKAGRLGTHDPGSVALKFSHLAFLRVLALSLSWFPS